MSTGRSLQQAREAKGYSVEELAGVLHRWRRLSHLSPAAIAAGVHALERGEAIRDAALASAVRVAVGVDGSRANPGMSGAHLLPRGR
ncbi:MAG: hypothetical protein KC549_07460 [Myxococcales bacterium]|nr:hypothetical protein [Myxococcales bacterium]